MSDTTPISPASEREAFVAWAKKEHAGLGMHPHRDGGFLWATTQAMWDAWQARAALSHPSYKGNLTMTTDRELLEKAAKAAGVNLEWVGEGSLASCFDPAAEKEWWNPLTDDGDALRLAVELEIDISLYAEKGGCVYAQSKHLLGFGTDGNPSYQAHEYMKEAYGSDKTAATRRAIVRAAAAIGEQMQ